MLFHTLTGIAVEHDPLAQKGHEGQIEDLALGTGTELGGTHTPGADRGSPICLSVHISQRLQ